MAPTAALRIRTSRPGTSRFCFVQETAIMVHVAGIRPHTPWNGHIMLMQLTVPEIYTRHYRT